MTITELIDFDALVTAAGPVLAGAVAAAAVFGAGVMVARMGWKFVKSFMHG